ncbi:MAG: hypothetical protein K2K84_09945 [Muribaculaceae bacterium]|nr:hypothetical protein [Muribaculaceae bacterium]
MSKLQLYISKSFRGYKVLFNVNPSEEVTNHIHELRQDIEQVTYDASEKNIFYLLSSTDEGFFVTIIRTIPSMPVDHLAAWIYIPGDAVISSDELKQVVATTARKVSGERVSAEDTADLRELFSTDYPVDPEAPAVIPSNRRGQLAWRRYHGETGVKLDRFFGDGLFQLYYADYSGIMLVDEDLGIKVSGVDLTDTPIGKPAILLPPKKSEQGFVAHIYGQVFDRPFRGSLESNLPIVWKRPGFEDVDDAQVVTSEAFMPALVETDESRKAVSKSSFEITSQSSGRHLEDCHIIVNGVEMTDEPQLFTQHELVQASVVINCEGYYPYTAHIDLASSTCALVILKERMKIYKFEIPTKSTDLGSPVEFTLYSKKPLSESPIEGYRLLDNIQEGESRINHLGFSGGSGSWTHKLMFFVIGLGLGLIGAVGLSKCSGSKASEDDADTTKTEQQTILNEPGDASETTAEIQKPAKQAEQPKATSVTDESISYLDNNEEWTKKRLESLPGLAGLYDDLNNFRTDRVVNVWAEKLSNSKRFSKLATHMRDGRNKAKAKALQGTKFNPETKTTINVRQYEFKVNP